jgi:hypothetical protein
MSSKAVAAVIAAVAVGAGVIWLIAKGKKPAADKGRDKAKDKANFDALDRLVAQSQSQAQMPTQSAMAPSINWPRYDDYYNRYVAFRASLPVYQQNQLPLPPLSPDQARNTYLTDAQATAVVNNHAAQVASIWPQVQAQAAPVNAATTMPTTYVAPSLLPTSSAMPLQSSSVAMTPSAMTVSVANSNLIGWRNGLGLWGASLPASTVMTAPTVPTIDVNSSLSPAILRQAYANAAAWRARLPATYMAQVPVVPALPLGFPV